jgi:hypothetical protein
MAGFFDSIGKLDENNPQALEGFNTADSNQVATVQQLYAQDKGIHVVGASKQRDALNAGLVRVGDSDKFVTPSMMLAQAKDKDTQLRMQMAEDKYKEIRNSVGFRIGDTLADTGRLFLSPLFWLGGEDTSRYDPSAKLDAGYRQQFLAAEGMRTAVYQAADNQRQTRASYLEQLNQNRITNFQNQTRLNQASAFAGMTEADKTFRSWADGTYGKGTYDKSRQDPVMFKKIFGEYNVSATGKAIRIDPVGDFEPVIMNLNTYSEVDEVAKRFKSDNFRDSIEKYQQLIAALDADSPVGNIAAVFQFMKQLDPTSVVRDSEYRVVAGAGAALDKVKMLERQFKEGNFLPAKIIEDLRNVSTELMQINMATYDAGRSSALNKLGMFGVSDENGLGQRFLGNDVFSEYRPQEKAAPIPVGTSDDGQDYYEDELGFYVINDDGSRTDVDVRQ